MGVPVGVLTERIARLDLILCQQNQIKIAFSSACEYLRIWVFPS
jgi:hypothetical protein